MTPNLYQRRILAASNYTGKHVYGYAGTVDPAAVAKRRAKYKAARKARRAAR